MTDFKRGDKVQVRTTYSGWASGFEYIGPIHDCSAFHTVIDSTGATWTYDGENIRRAPRVVKQMCQWWEMGESGRIFAQPADLTPVLYNAHKVGEPFEQTLEIPE